MRAWIHDRFTFPLPGSHKFPAGKYTLLRARLDGFEFLEAEPASWERLGRIQDGDLLRRIREGALGERELRGLGLPWSPELVERHRRTAWGTVETARAALSDGVGLNLGGGNHHAGRAFARGYCLFNDVALAVAELRDAGLAQRAVVIDCDVHQGDGTADLLGGRADLNAFTVSLHGARNYPFKRIPSDLDVDLPTGTGDADYLAALHRALSTALDHGPFDIAFYLAGADPWEGDRLGRLSLTKAGLRERDATVLDALHPIPTTVVLAGGYAPDVTDTVDINAATAHEVAARL